LPLAKGLSSWALALTRIGVNRPPRGSAGLVGRTLALACVCVQNYLRRCAHLHALAATHRLSCGALALARGGVDVAPGGCAPHIGGALALTVGVEELGGLASGDARIVAQHLAPGALALTRTGVDVAAT